MRAIIEFLSLSLFALLLFALLVKSPASVKPEPVIVPSAPVVQSLPKSLGGVDDLTTLKSDVSLNNQVDSVASVIADQQASYIGSNSKYFQGLITHSVPPTYGQVSAPDKLGSKPSYQSADWSSFGEKSDSLPFATTINQMAYPDGSLGYQVVFTLSLNSERYSKAIGYGLQAQLFTHDWQKDEKPY